MGSVVVAVFDVLEVGVDVVVVVGVSVVRFVGLDVVVVGIVVGRAL